ncbi:hypothetical protein T484DRAFT_1779904, partial [Baffinella frigidus]
VVGAERDAAVQEQIVQRDVLEAINEELRGVKDERDRLLEQHTTLATTNAATLVELQDVQTAHADLAELTEDLSTRADTFEKHKIEALARIAALETEKEGLTLSLARESDKAAEKEKALAAQHKINAGLQTDIDEAENQARPSQK